MKILVSDYDNTFHIKDEYMEYNIKKANEFMKNNIFVIATGRSYDSYMKQKEKYNITTNYTIINHGATILKDDNIIYNKPMDNEIKKILINSLELDKAKYFYCYKGIDEVDINESDITKILIVYNDYETSNKVKKLIEENYYKELCTFRFSTPNSLEILGKVDKYYAVDYICKLENIKDVYVIGDNYNDYLMIKNYNGFCTNVAIDEIKQIARKEYSNVSDLIDDIESDVI